MRRYEKPARLTHPCSRSLECPMRSRAGCDTAVPTAAPTEMRAAVSRTLGSAPSPHAAGPLPRVHRCAINPPLPRPVGHVNTSPGPRWVKGGVRATHDASSVDVKAVEPSSRWLPGACNLPRAALCVALGLAIKLFIPMPTELSESGWNMLCIFASTIAGVVLKPLPMSAWSFLGATAAVATRSASFPDTFRAFTHEAFWLVTLSFFLAKAVENSGLGDRLACLFVRAFGRSPLGLAYALVAAETALAPAMPSSAARAGAVFNPMIASVSKAAGSMPNHPSRHRLGRFLTMCQLQCSVASSAMFLTACAQSFLCVRLAGEAGVTIPSPFFTWFKAASVPALTSLVVTPLLLLKLTPPELGATPEAPQEARRRLAAMGAMTGKERIVAGVMVATLGLWVAGHAVGVSPTTAAMLSLSTLMFTGSLTWSECLDNRPAWDNLIWFGLLLGMAAHLSAVGVIPHLARQMGAAITQRSGSWVAAFCALNVGYFLQHYMFASQTAHVGALYAAYLSMMMGAGVPGLLAALALAYGSAINAAVTHYASGQSAVYVGSGYVTAPEVFRCGAIVGLMNLFVIWGGLGMAWWKFLGLW